MWTISWTDNTYPTTEIHVNGTLYSEVHHDTESEMMLYINNKVKQKKADGYADSKEGARCFVDSRVMLAKRCKLEDLRKWWKKHVPEGGYLLAQKKLNGVRATWDGGSRFHSRLGNPFLKLQFPNCGQHPSYRIDGELYSHDHNLEEIIEMVKGERCKDSLCFYMFDLMDTSVDSKYINRLDSCAEYEDIPNGLIRVGSEIVTKPGEALSLMKEYVDEGYEGLILRKPYEPYEFGRRTHQILKVKPTISMEFKIIAFERDVKNRVVFHCLTSEGRKFKVVPAWRDDKRMLSDSEYMKLIGSLMTIVFYEWTRDGVPRHGIGISIRDYE